MIRYVPSCGITKEEHFQLFFFLSSSCFKIQNETDGLYRVIQKVWLNFISLYFKIRTSDKYNVNYIWLYSQWSLQMFNVPPFLKTGTGSFPGVKRPGRGADHPPPSKCRGQERVGLYLYSPLGLHGLLGEHLYLYLYPPSCRTGNI